MSQERPSFDDVLRARDTIRPYLTPTPLLSYPLLNQMLGADVYVKREDCQPTSAFKVRGGVNLVANLSVEERTRGIIGVSTGNHGQSLAFAAGLFGVRCVIVVPEGANPTKVTTIQALGAEVRFHGRDFDEARTYVESDQDRLGMRYVHSANEPLLIAGVATETLEVMEAVPDLDYLFVPLGAGSGAAGACIVAKSLNPVTQVVAVQSAQAPAGYESWKARSLVERPMKTVAEGLATGSGYQLTQEIIWDKLGGFVLVDDSELESAIVSYIEYAHVLAEHAGAAALAGALKSRGMLQGKKVALILSGANITLTQLQSLLLTHTPK